ncbi:MAG: hypothetical protein MZW92_17355 [Comamonadaceae bacterium]|nr:hypothetical protein [Comamonadaceae bacterium]
MRGPITYDLASLLRDAFVSWDEEQRARLGRALVAAGAPRRRCWPALAQRLRRVLARARVDGPAAPPEGAGHLLPPEAPRRQAERTAPTCRASSPMPRAWRRVMRH